MASAARKYVLYADGACLGNPGPGGWGVVIAEPAERVSRAERRTLSSDHQQQDGNHGRASKDCATSRRAPKSSCAATAQYVVNTMMMGWKRNANRRIVARARSRSRLAQGALRMGARPRRRQEQRARRQARRFGREGHQAGTRSAPASARGRKRPGEARAAAASRENRSAAARDAASHS